MPRSRRRYYIKATKSHEWIECSKEDYVHHERAAQFRNVHGPDTEPATGSFSNSTYDYQGRIVYGDTDPNV